MGRMSRKGVSSGRVARFLGKKVGAVLVGAGKRQRIPPLGFCGAANQKRERVKVAGAQRQKKFMEKGEGAGQPAKFKT